MINVEIKTAEEVDTHYPVGELSVEDSIVYSNNKFNYKILCKQEAFEGIANLLTNDNFLNKTKLFFKDPSEYFISLISYPFNIARFFGKNLLPQENITVGGVDTGGKGYPLGEFLPVYCIGGFKLTSNDNSFIDYKTKIQLYIPYCGFIDLDTVSILNKQVYVYLSIDFDNGNCVGYVQVEDKKETLIASLNGKCGNNIPLGKTNNNELTKNFIASSAVSAFTTMGTAFVGGLLGSPAIAIGALAAGAGGVLKSGYDNSQLHTDIINKPNGNTFLTMPKYPFLKITVPNEIQVGYAKTIGYPLEREMLLNELNGFTIVNEIHLNGFDRATSSELSELENILKTGIII